MFLCFLRQNHKDKRGKQNTIWHKAYLGTPCPPLLLLPRSAKTWPGQIVQTVPGQDWPEFRPLTQLHKARLEVLRPGEAECKLLSVYWHARECRLTCHPPPDSTEMHPGWWQQEQLQWEAECQSWVLEHPLWHLLEVQTHFQLPISIIEVATK